MRTTFGLDTTVWLLPPCHLCSTLSLFHRAPRIYQHATGHHLVIDWPLIDHMLFLSTPTVAYWLEVSKPTQGGTALHGMSPSVVSGVKSPLPQCLCTAEYGDWGGVWLQCACAILHTCMMAWSPARPSCWQVATESWERTHPCFTCFARTDVLVACAGLPRASLLACHGGMEPLRPGRWS